MAKLKVMIGFTRYKDAELNQKANHILQCMAENPHFVTPTPKLADIETANNNYGDALGKVMDGTKQDTVLKNQARSIVEMLLTQLGLYIQLNSNDDAAIILSSGYDISGGKSPIGVLPKPDKFKADVTKAPKGSINVSLKSIAGASSYQYEYTETPVTTSSLWKTVVDTSSSINISSLQSGKEYAFRVAGIGSDPTRVYSDILDSLIL